MRNHPVRTYRLLAVFLSVLAAVDVVVFVRYVNRDQLVLSAFIGVAAFIYAALGIVALIYADRINGGGPPP